MKVWFYSAQNESPNTARGAGSPGVWVPSSDPGLDGYMFRTVLCVEPTKTETADGAILPAKGHIHKYHGPLVLDVDTCSKKGIDDLAASWETAKVCVETLADVGVNPKSGIEIFFSGAKGYHIIVPPGAFGMDDTFVYNLPYIYKAIVAKMGLLPLVDASLYSAGWGKQFRLPNQKRCIGFDDAGLPVYGMCKVQLTLEEFLLGPDVHRILAVSPRPLFPADSTPVPQLVELFEEAGKKARA